MQQVVFHFPGVGWPLYGFGAMLLLAFFVVMRWGRSRAPKVGLPYERYQDMCMLLLAAGIGGARVLYMWQYADKFPDKTIPGLVFAFFRIWDGGIVFYGSLFGGILAYLVFWIYVLRPLRVNTWHLMDVIAPMLAIGMAIGRIGCYLNGCCWGQVACPEAQPVPLAAELGKFPLLTAHARDQVVFPANSRSRLPQICGLQTTTGFSLKPRQEFATDVRAVVLAVEPGSQAEAAGLMAGDTIREVNGKPNSIVLEILGDPRDRDEARSLLSNLEGVTFAEFETQSSVGLSAEFPDPATIPVALGKLAPLKGRAHVNVDDRFVSLIRNWPRGESKLSLVVERAGKTEAVSFTPRTMAFFPTQIYETVSMVLLTLLLVAYQPFRRHPGQLIVVLMLCYAMHRFLNEAIRIEPTYSLGLTLSQWISVGIFAAGLLIEVYLRLTQTKLPRGLNPLGEPTTANPTTEKLEPISAK
jgi:phosphatidylglycerol---prolipoprotein diacylglyceryl transferase